MACAPGSAEGALFLYEGQVPDAVREYFASNTFSGYTIGAQSCMACGYPVSGAWHSFFFAVAQKESRNVLYGFRDSGSGFRHFLTTDSAIPQGKGTFTLCNAKGNAASFKSFADETLKIIYQKQDNEEFYNLCLFFIGGGSDVWNLCYVCANDTDTQFDEARVAKDGVNMYFEGEKLGSAYGVVETNLRYFSWDAFPKTLREAREKLTNPPDIPSGTVSAQRVRFTGGQKFDVYTGPGTEYDRAGNGKAAVSTNDWIQVFGSEDGWIMIQYDISSSRMRIGYIASSALPSGASVSPLRLDDAEAEITKWTGLTDDPLNSQEPFRVLDAGQKVTWLAVMGNWVYVEVKGAGWLCRGFVPSDAVRKTAARAYSASFSGKEYTAQANALFDGREAYVVVSVTGPAAWLAQGSDVVTGYAVYANNLPVNMVCTAVSQHTNVSWQNTYTLTGALPEGAAVLGLCPIRAQSGLTADEMIVMRLDEIK